MLIVSCSAFDVFIFTRMVVKVTLELCDVLKVPKKWLLYGIMEPQLTIDAVVSLI